MVTGRTRRDDSERPHGRGATAPRANSKPKAGRVAARLLDRVRGEVSDQLNTRKDRIIDRLESVADTVRRMGEPLYGEPLGTVGEYVGGAADRLEGLAAGLRERDVADLAGEVGKFARRRPAAFVGAGLAAGLLAARFLKSSSVEAESRRAARRAERSEAAERGGRHHREANAPSGGRSGPGEIARKRSM